MSISRRDFLKRISVGTAIAIVAPAALAGMPESAMSPLTRLSMETPLIGIDNREIFPEIIRPAETAIDTDLLFSQIEAVPGMAPNIMWIRDECVYEVLRRHPDIIKRVEEGQDDDR